MKRRSTWRPQLVLMVKAPEAGRVKTRLARGIGLARALRFYRSATSALSRRISSDGRWQTWLAVAPERALHHPIWPRNVPRRGQGSGDLGQRMQKVFDELPPGPVIIIGSDIPSVTPAHIARAFRKLGRADLVFGPATDGGYWLVGAKRHPNIPDVFRDVRWSHQQTLADTIANAGGLRVELADTLDDVDEPGDLQGSAVWSGRIIIPASINPRTRNSASCPSPTDKPAHTC